MIKLHLFAAAIGAVAGLMVPNMTLASPGADFDLNLPMMETAPVATKDDGSFEIAKRGRGRGRGGDRDRGGNDDSRDDRDHDRARDRGDDRSGGGRRPRIPGGSGCDDPGDVAEHPECQV